MYTLVAKEEALDLLSCITAKKLSQKDATPSVIFLASLITVLLGVIFVDGKVAAEEKKTLLTTLYRFSTPESQLRKLTHLMIKGVKENQLYRKSEDLVKLTDSLTESQRLLLIAFGYEMSAVDGEMDSREKYFLETVGKHLNINFQHLTLLETAFNHQEDIDLVALEEVRFLLAPSQFKELDTVFVKAARDMLAMLPDLPEKQLNQKSVAVSYDELKNFKEHCQKLDKIYNQIFQIFQDCQERGLISDNFISEAKEIWIKNQTEQFRLAVVGEFSQGKSTLLNALLGEEIQPAREIPCSAVVTVLKYGSEKRVICRYKDGREEEIPFNEYQDKASISEDAAIDCLSDELAKSEIEEIIFEHPDLELCKSGVEIVDSPGLNEHPERTAITQKILKNTDAAIFITNASRPLTQGERDLIQEIKAHLNGGLENKPANNLFVACNFMDLIRTDKGKEQIQQRITKFVQGDKPIITGENRVHFISAQAAIDGIIIGSQDSSYVVDFNNFVSSIEKFLIFERGEVKLERLNTILDNFNQKCEKTLIQAQNTVEGKIKISGKDKQEVIEQIGEISGRYVKIYSLAKKLRKDASLIAIRYFKKWHENLKECITENSKSWKSEHSSVWSQDKLIKDYTNQFVRDLSGEIDEWGTAVLKDKILQKYINYLDGNIKLELSAIQTDFKNLDMLVHSDFSSQLQLSIDSVKDDFIGFAGIGGGIGIGGALAAGLLVFTGVGFIAVIVASVAATIAGSFGLGMFDIDRLHDQIKLKIIEEGLKKFDESIDNLDEKINEIVNKVIDSKIASVHTVIYQAISLYENLLQQQEHASEETAEQLEAEKLWIVKKRHELEQIQQEMQSIMVV